MKKKLFMDKSGFSLVEIIVSILIFGILFTGFFYFFGKYNTSKKNREKELNYQITINGCYECFTTDPFNFIQNIYDCYPGCWRGDCFYFDDYPDLHISYLNDYAINKITVYINNEEVESWTRVKAGLY